MARSSSEHRARSAAALRREYMAGLPPSVRRRLEEMRAVIRSAAPGATEIFSYRIPGFQLDEKPLVWYAAFKAHTSLYPITDAIRHAHAGALEGYQTSKGTVRFALAEPLPAALVRRLVKARVAEIRGGRARTPART